MFLFLYWGILFCCCMLPTPYYGLVWNVLTVKNRQCCVCQWMKKKTAFFGYREIPFSEFYWRTQIRTPPFGFFSCSALWWPELPTAERGFTIFFFCLLFFFAFWRWRYNLTVKNMMCSVCQWSQKNLFLGKLQRFTFSVHIYHISLCQCFFREWFHLFLWVQRTVSPMQQFYWTITWTI